MINQKGGNDGSGKVRVTNKSTGGNVCERENGEVSGSFTPQQQKAIIEHLLITKNSSPQKNYSHVPCKFFLQGNCQAGQSCPFSHSLNTSVADQTPCKYFQKGNCKFGMKCANAHILANGTRVNPRRSSMSNSLTGKSANQGVALVGTASYMMPPGERLNGFNGPAADCMKHEHTPLAVNFTNYTPAVNSNAANAMSLSQFRQTADSSMISMLNQDPQVFCAAESSFYPVNNSITMNASGQQTDDFQAEESMLIPGELSDLLTPMEVRRRETFKNFSYPKFASSQNGSFPSSLGEPQLSYSSSSSSSDYSWRNVISSNQNIDYWQNLEHIENDLNKFKIDEHDEDKLNNMPTTTEKPAMALQTFSANHDTQTPAPNETQFFFDDLHGGIY